MKSFFQITFFIFLLFFFNCKIEYKQINVLDSCPLYSYKIIPQISNPILEEIIFDKFKKINNFQNQQSKNNIFLKIKIRLKNTSNDFFRNTFYSLLTFTLGTFITTSSDVIYEVEFSNHDKNQTLKKEYKTNSTFGLWAIMPPLIGLVSTIGGTLLNNYRTPDKLERNCLNDPPGKIRKVLEESQENYCKNYKEILTNSFLEIEPEFLKDINSLIKEDNNEN